jgi:hypothetical protein
MSSSSLPRAGSPRRHLSLAFGAAALTTGLYAAWLGWQVGGKTTVLYMSDAGTVLASLVASLTCFLAGRRHDARLRAFWWLLAAACGAWMLGEVIWSAYDLAGTEPPIPSLADLGYLAFIPLAVGALLCHPEIRGGGTRRARFLLDGLAIAVGLLFLSWISILGPLARSTDLTSLGGIVTVAYPFGDVVIAIFVVFLLQSMATVKQLGLWCLLAGLIALALADSAYAYIVYVKHYTAGSPIDVGWVVGFVGIALGAFVSEVSDLPVRARSSSHTLKSLVAPLLPVLVALSVAGISFNPTHRPDRVALMLVLALVLLALARQALLLVDFVAAGRHGQRGHLIDRLTRAALGPAVSEEAESKPSRFPAPKGS